jgi:hypothetical protein
LETDGNENEPGWLEKHHNVDVRGGLRTHLFSLLGFAQVEMQFPELPTFEKRTAES